MHSSDCEPEFYTKLARNNVISNGKSYGRVSRAQDDGIRAQKSIRSNFIPSRHPSSFALLSRICMNERKRLRAISTDSLDEREQYVARAFDSARDVIYPHLIWELAHSWWRREGRRGQAIRLFRFQRYQTTRERILINGSSFTRAPGVSEDANAPPGFISIPLAP